MTVTINGTSGLSGAIVGKIDGDQSAPTLQGVDTNTGVFFPVADAMAFSANGTEKVRMIANGNFGFASKTAPYTVSANGQLQSTQGAYLATSGGSVGIGTSSPISKLHVTTSTGQVDNDGLIKVEYSGSTSTVNSGVNVKNYSGTSQFMQWENYGVRIGSRIKTNTGAGAVIFTYGNDSEGMRIDGSGRVTKLSQPAFFARGTAGDVTTTNLYDFVFDSAAFNIGGHYNTSNGRFTAPIAGVYAFQYNLFNNGGTGRISLKYNGASYQNHQMNCGALSTPITQAITMYLNAGDYVTVGDWQSISGKVIYIGHSYFCGHLVS